MTNTPHIPTEQAGSCTEVNFGKVAPGDTAGFLHLKHDSFYHSRLRLFDEEQLFSAVVYSKHVNQVHIEVNK